jgi:hypothetical protein
MSRDWTNQTSIQRSSELDGRATQISPGKSTLVDELDAYAAGPVQAKASGVARPTPTAESTAVQLKALESILMRAFRGAPSEDGSVPDEQLSASGSGVAMPAPVQAKMEKAFGANLSAVRIHEGPQAESIGAAAYTRGTDIHFAPGQYDPNSERGQELLGHELTHVVQQSQGRVPTGVQGKGAVTINSDAGLEQEADVLGAKAARGERVSGGSGGSGAAAGAVQRKRAAQRKEGEGEQPGGMRELTDAELEELYPPATTIPVSLDTFKLSVIQPAYTSRRPLGNGPKWTKIGHLFYEHIFFEDGKSPPNIGHMGKVGLGQDTETAGYQTKRGGLDDNLMRQAVVNVGDPGAYSLLSNNCQHYVGRVTAEYDRLHAQQQK